MPSMQLFLLLCIWNVDTVKSIHPASTVGLWLVVVKFSTYMQLAQRGLGAHFRYVRRRAAMNS
jgi:hypothetical protein